MLLYSLLVTEAVFISILPYVILQSLKPITSLPTWAHDAFTGYRSLNRIQSRLADTALHSDENILLCAPTVSLIIIFYM